MPVEALPLLIAAIFILAATPGPGVLITVARAVDGGLSHATFTIIGILLGDVIFILLVTFGLKIIAESLSTLFIIIKYAGGAYLIWLGLSLLLNKPKPIAIKTKQQKSKKMSLLTDLLAGLTVTLSNPKAIVFYLSFLPAFMDLQALTTIDILFITSIIVVVIGSVMMGYALIAIKAKHSVNSNHSGLWMRRIAGSLMASTGGWLLIRN